MDIQTEAELVVNIDGPPCNPCSSSDTDLFIATTLNTECGPVEWRVLTTCFVSRVTAIHSPDGQAYTLEGRLCGEGSSTWSVSPDDPLVVHDPPLHEVFSAGSIPTGDYSFEVEYQAGSDLSTAVFDVTME